MVTGVRGEPAHRVRTKWWLLGLEEGQPQPADWKLTAPSEHRNPHWATGRWDLVLLISRDDRVVLHPFRPFPFPLRGGYRFHSQISETILTKTCCWRDRKKNLPLKGRLLKPVGAIHQSAQQLKKYSVQRSEKGRRGLRPSLRACVWCLGPHGGRRETPACWGLARAHAHRGAHGHVH